MAEIKLIRNSQVKRMLPKRNAASHKGQNGRVLIVGGGIEYHGAPVLSGLGSLYSGADIVYLYVPEVNFDVTRALYPDFIVKKYPGEYLTERYVPEIVEFGKKCGSVLIGPGLGDQESSMDAVKQILEELHIPTVLDAQAIQVLKKIEKFPLMQPVVVTPHMNEFRNLVDRDVVVKKDDPQSMILLRSISMDLHINILLKGETDYISSGEGYIEMNRTGNPGMTVGGSGDVLAGVVATLLAQGMEAYGAARCAAYLCGAAGDRLMKKMGYNYTSRDLALSLHEVF